MVLAEWTNADAAACLTKLIESGMGGESSRGENY